MTLIGSLMATEETAVREVPEGVSFDGMNDYLKRTTDLEGNITSSKTFTFSSWVYFTSPNDKYDMAYLYGSTAGPDANANHINISISENQFSVYFRNASNIFGVTVNAPPKHTWIHILFSIDLSDPANRFLYFNDIQQPDSAFSTYVNEAVIVARPEHFIGINAYYGLSNPSIGKSKYRQQHLFLDYTYRDLSIEANRRLFITEDGKPADGLADLSPILYLPMKDKETAHINEGTGGDFVQQGVLDTAQRGPNQWNCVASEFDGVDDYLSKSITGWSDTYEFVLSFTANQSGSTSVVPIVITLNTGDTYRFEPIVLSDYIQLVGKDAAGTIILNAKAFNVLAPGSQVHISISIDMRDSALCRWTVNGKDVSNSAVYTTLTSAPLPFSGANLARVQTTTAGSARQGSVGELYFDTSYINLSVDNPFWDSEANRPKPVRQVLEETGNTPLIAMPISADNPGKNYGTGGDFTLNGGGLKGARGMSEFIARSVKFDGGSVQYLSNPLAEGTTQKILAFLSFYTDWQDVKHIIDSSDRGLRVFSSNDSLFIRIYDSGGVEFIEHRSSGHATNGWNTLLFSLDVTNQAMSKVYLNGVDITFFNSFSNKDISLDHITKIGNFQSSYADFILSSSYMASAYIDLSQEENRNLFVDQLGYPKDLSKQIADGLIPEPLIYLPFDDPNNLGKNLGTGGDFTVNGTITQGPDFSL